MFRLVILTTLGIITAANAAASIDDVAGAYALLQGAPTCPKQVKFARNASNLVAADVTVDGTVCSSGSLTFKLKSEQLSRPLQILLQRSDIGDFLQGTPKDDLVCANTTYTSIKPLYLVKPNRDVDGIDEQTQSFIGSIDSHISDVTLRSDKAYLITHNKCAYSRSAKPEDESPGIVKILTGCFPAHATVQLPDRVVPMHQLRIGDTVLVAPRVYSRVFAWTHTDASHVGHYVRIRAADRQLVLTDGHFVYADGRPIPARHVRVGHTLRSSTGAVLRVHSVETVVSKGLYNPQTLHGDIVVDGVVATTYTEAVEPVIAHALLAPLRLAFSAAAALRTVIAS